MDFWLTSCKEVRKKMLVWWASRLQLYSQPTVLYEDKLLLRHWWSLTYRRNLAWKIRLLKGFNAVWKQAVFRRENNQLGLKLPHRMQQKISFSKVKWSISVFSNPTFQCSKKGRVKLLAFRISVSTERFYNLKSWRKNWIYKLRL